jgi:thioredoxin-dependent peroxiredoxin
MIILRRPSQATAAILEDSKAPRLHAIDASGGSPGPPLETPGAAGQCRPDGEAGFGGDRTDPIMRQNEGDMAKDLAEGDPAPDFELPTDGGGRARLADLKGKPAVIYFYPKDDTSGCTAEAIAFNALRAKFAAAGTAVIGVSPDSAASHDKFKRKHELKIALAADPERSAIEAYGVWKEKSMYGRKYFGVERSTFLMDRTGRIAKIWRKVKVPGHAEEVLAAAKGL